MMNCSIDIPGLVVSAPFGERRVLLHTCCAPCSSAIVECLMRSGITPTIFYSNPNIWPEREYAIRRDECSRYASALGLEVVDADYDHDVWLSGMRGLEDEPERGSRCLCCFKLRLYRTALYAAQHGFRVITTTLASSRWKSLDQINTAGHWAVDKVNAELPGAGLVWWEQNWRKGGLQQRRQQIIRDYDFYNQQYCGCEFSLRASAATSVNRELVREEIQTWIQEKAIPRYDAFDKGHRRDHAEYVLKTALELSRYYDVDREMVAVAAACHDLGLEVDRKTHHLESGRIIRGLTELRKWFSSAQIETIAQAAEDHRASSKDEPRSIYGKIVAEADRQIIPEVVIRRTIQYGLKNYPELDREGHWQRTVEHLEEKYAEGGYLKLWIPESPNAARLEQLRAIIKDKDALRAIFEKTYDEELDK